MQKLTRLLIIYTAIVVTILLIITFLSIRDSAKQNKRAESTIDSLKQELAKITAFQQSEKETVQKLPDNTEKGVMGTSNQEASDSSKITSGFVTINDEKWQTVDAYESNSYSSKIVGKIEFDKAYRYLKKMGSWYQIVLPKSETNGWVAGRFLKEIDNEP